MFRGHLVQLLDDLQLLVFAELDSGRMRRESRKFVSQNAVDIRHRNREAFSFAAHQFASDRYFERLPIRVVLEHDVQKHVDVFFHPG